MSKHITLVFENCEDIILEINKQVHFYIEDLMESYNLDCEKGELVKSVSFREGYLVIPNDVIILCQTDLSKFIGKGALKLSRITEWDDITSIHINDKVICPYWSTDGSCNTNQNHYTTKEGNILVDWGDCFKDSENSYFSSSNEEELLQAVDSLCTDWIEDF
ncbi:hypothetical protein NVP1101O_137 [Vibrio phage 1.101.O._10N.261.45.C6]|nr:hypothetical protein NVP1101O_137 [Vibrio phage 1.101.O._10N.261.45.C6]